MNLTGLSEKQKTIDKAYKIIYNVFQRRYNMAQTTLNVRMDEDLKTQFNNFCEEVGMSMSTAVCMFAKNTVKNKALPFSVTTRRQPIDYREAQSVEDYNDETKAVIKQAYEHPESLHGPYTSKKELFKALYA